MWEGDPLYHVVCSVCGKGGSVYVGRWSSVVCSMWKGGTLKSVCGKMRDQYVEGGNTNSVYVERWDL